MNSPFLSRRSTFGVTNALMILIIICFCLPFAIRGARLGLRQTENNVKDWLPDSFRETAELAWFSQYFPGERFIIASWPGCTEEDQRLRLLMARLNAESVEGGGPSSKPSAHAKAEELAEDLKLLAPADFHYDWGRRKEKWLTNEHGDWYFITPDGRLYRWDGVSSMMSGAARAALRLISKKQVEGQFIAGLGSDEEGKESPYYTNPYLLTAKLIQKAQTGPDLAAMLAREGGPLWPMDTTSAEQKPIVAHRLALERLTGTLFSPAVPAGFSWTPDAFESLIPASQKEKLPENWRHLIESVVHKLLQDHFEGDLAQLQHASGAEKTRSWYQVFDALGIEPPPRQTAVLVTLTDFGERSLANVAGRGVLGEPRGRLLQLAEDAGIAPPPTPSLLPPPLNRLSPPPVAMGATLHLGGPPVTNLAIDEEGSITLVRLIGYSILIGITLTYLCFRNIKVTLMVFFAAGASAAACLGFVWWGGDKIDAILLSMPPLIYVMTLSSAIHLINYYREEVNERGIDGAAERAVAHGWLPCTLAAVTTAIGMMSLYTSNLLPIRKFGWYSAIGVISALILVFAYLPSALFTFAPGWGRDEKKGERKWLESAWSFVGAWIARHNGFVAAGCFTLIVVGCIGLTQLKTSVQLLKLFSPESQTINDYAWLEENFGRLIPMELVLRVPPSEQKEKPEASGNPLALTKLERVEAVRYIQRVVEQAFGEAGSDEVGRAMSSAAFMPPLPPPARGYDPLRANFNRALLESDRLIADSDYMRSEAKGHFEGSELWRVSLRVAALGDVDYGDFIGELRTAVEPIVQAYRVRAEILTAVQSQTKEFGRVVLLGLPEPKPLTEVNIHPQASGNASVPAASKTTVVNSQAIFESVLSELIQNSPLRSARWLDPTQGGLQGKSTDPAWGKALSSVECVVLLRDHPDYDVGFIEKNARKLVDARRAFAEQSIPDMVEGIPVVANAGPIHVVYTGAVPVVYKAQRTLLKSLVESIAWAFVLIAAVMACLLNPGRTVIGFFAPKNVALAVSGGLLSMLPNIFPLAIIFGFMGYYGTAVDIGTMMTASVALGVAVDDTIHFLSWFRDGLAAGLDRRSAVAEAYRRVGPAMTQTTIVGGLGLFVFALSTFTPTMRFGVLMLVLLVAALVGDLIFLPALLAGPLGKLFRPREGAVVSTAMQERAKELLQGDRMNSEEPETPSSRSSASGNASDVQAGSLPHIRVERAHERQKTNR